MDGTINVAEVQQNLERYKQKLARAVEKYGENSRVVSLDADAVARNYDLLGKHDEAKHFFDMAAEIGLAILDDRLQQTERPDYRGDSYTEVARFLWRAGDSRSVDYWQQALKSYQHGYDSQNETIRHHSLLWSVYALLFLGEYDKAKNIVAAVQQIEDQSDITYSKSPTMMLQKVIDALGEGSLEAVQRGLVAVKEYLNQIDYKPLYTGNTMPYVDIYELVKQTRHHLQKI